VPFNAVRSRGADVTSVTVEPASRGRCSGSLLGRWPIWVQPNRGRPESLWSGRRSHASVA